MVSIHIFRCLFDHLKAANMVNMVGFIDPAAVSADAGSLTDRSRLVANRLQKTDGEQIFLMPYNPGLVSKQKTGFCLYDALHIKLYLTFIFILCSRHWVLIIVRAKKETVYFLDPLPGNRVVDEDGKNIVNSALKMYNTHIGRVGRKTPLWKTLPGTPKQPSSVECGYYVMRFMRDIIKDTSLDFEKTVRRKFSDLFFMSVFILSTTVD